MTLTIDVPPDLERALQELIQELQSLVRSEMSLPSLPELRLHLAWAKPSPFGWDCPGRSKVAVRPQRRRAG